MTDISKVLGERLKAVRIVPNQDYSDNHGHILADSIVFSFERREIQFVPVEETDEIEVEIASTFESTRLTNRQDSVEFHSIVGKTFSEYWNCSNSRGYFDLAILAFGNLQPKVLILSEGGVLKLFDASRGMNSIEQRVAKLK